MYKLSSGALDKIMNGIDIEKPVLQILGHKKLSSSNLERYRLLVSDGLRINSFTMLATQLNPMITDGILTEYAVCEISKYALSSVNNGGKEKRVMVILSIEIIASGQEVGHKIGNPTNADSKEPETAKPNIPALNQQNNDIMQTGTFNNHNTTSDISTTPIAALSPYQNRWVIRARITSKSPIKTWSNSRGEGKLFSMDLIDESGEIRCTAFRDLCDKFYDMLEAGKVYYISRCILKVANKAFSSLKNDYEMTMTGDTEIVLCHDNNEELPTLQFNFCPIITLENREKEGLIDILGVVTSCKDVQHITQRNTGRELIKRDLSVVDDSGASINVTLWGKQAEEFEGYNDPIIAVKGARIGEFNGGRNLSLLPSSVFEKDPDIPEAHKLRGWYSAGGHAQKMKSLSIGGGGRDFNAPLYTFEEANEAKIGENFKESYIFTVVATINLIRVENSIYKACPILSCKKKLIDQSTGVFRCEKCNKDYPNFAYRLLASMNIADATGNRWITAFNEDAEKILGMPAQELGELKENDNDAYMQKFGEASFKRFKFTLKVKSEVFQDEMRTKHTCISVTPLDHKAHLADLLEKVSELANITKLEFD